MYCKGVSTFAYANVDIMRMLIFLPKCLKICWNRVKNQLCSISRLKNSAEKLLMQNQHYQPPKLLKNVEEKCNKNEKKSNPDRVWPMDDIRIRECLKSNIYSHSRMFPKCTFITSLSIFI